MAFIRSLGHEPKKVGREYVMLCPFHDDHKPSFQINPVKGIYWCHVCRSGGDIFSFVKLAYGLDEFPDVLEFMADRLGLGKSEREWKARPVQAQPVRESTTMNSEQVYERMERLAKGKINPGPLCNALNVDPRALELIGGFFAPVIRAKSGEFETGGGMPCLIVPQRRSDGSLVSLRFRSMGPREKGERAKRWSLNVIEEDDGVKPRHEREQVLGTDAGLMGDFTTFSTPPAEGEISLCVEGETDLLAALTMVLDLNPRPARVFGQPGAASRHDLLIPAILGKYAWFFFDPDEAGRNAVFDTPKRKCELCNRGGRSPFCSKCGGRMRLCLGEPPNPGLIGKMKREGIQPIAAFPPVLPGGGKQDLRDLLRMGWTWDMLAGHILATGTSRERER